MYIISLLTVKIHILICMSFAYTITRITLQHLDTSTYKHTVHYCDHVNVDVAIAR